MMSVVLTKNRKFLRNFKNKFHFSDSVELDFKLERLKDQLETVLFCISIILLMQPIATICFGMTNSIYLTVLLAITGTFIIIRSFYELVLSSTSILIVSVLILSFTTEYSIDTFKNDYHDFIINLYENNFDPLTTCVDGAMEKILKEKMDYSSETREFAMEISTKNFEFAYNSFGTAVRYMSAYEEILSQWRFINEKGEYIQYVPDQIQFYKKNGYFAGDCDDFALLLANTFLCIGAESVRYVLIPGHIFIELNIKDRNSLDELVNLIGALYITDVDSLTYTNDDEGYWINFDWDGIPASKYDQDAVTNKIKI